MHDTKPSPSRPISAADQEIIDKLLSKAPLVLESFNWMSMAKWRTKKGVLPGVMAVEVVAERAADAPPCRFAPFPPRLVLAVDNGVVVFDDGRRVPAERAETFISAR